MNIAMNRGRWASVWGLFDKGTGNLISCGGSISEKPYVPPE
jgi:hypothetical protein